MLYDTYLKSLAECPFCTGLNEAIIDGVHSYVTYSIAPYHKHHLLILPKRHVESVEELSAPERAEIELLSNRAIQILRDLRYRSITLLEREGPINVNKSVSHTHFHVIPEIQIGALDHTGKPRRTLEKSEIADLLSELGSIVTKGGYGDNLTTSLR